jgi:hypothetical protein
MSIEQKIEQMYKALEEMQITEKLPTVKPEIKRTAGSISFSFDFKKGADSSTAANRASQLVANIACLKDHLKVWCAKRNKPFAGDMLIDSNKEVAIVHDLWNLDKHGKLDRSRSGLYPRLENPPRSTMVLKAEPGKPQPMFFIPIGGGGGPIQTKDGASLRIVANVVDKDGNPLGSLEDICEKAVGNWEAEFKKVGMTF